MVPGLPGRRRCGQPGPLCDEVAQLQDPSHLARTPIRRAAKAAVPRLIDLYDNPQERPEETTGESAVVTHAWVLHAMFAYLNAFQASLKTYPPIAPGTPDPYAPPRAP